MDTNFIIPPKFEDLCTFAPARYVVQGNYSVEEVEEFLPVIQTDFNDDGTAFILKHFDVFYFAIKHFEAADQKLNEKLWRTVVRATENLHTQLQDALDETVPDEEIDKQQLCNILKMLLYTFCLFVEKFEEGEAKGSAVSETEQTGKGRKKAGKTSERSHEWEKSKERGVDSLMKIMIMPLQRLFTPPVVDEALVTTVNHCCFKILENPSTVKKDMLKMNLFQIISHSVSRYRQSLNFRLAVVSYLQTRENMSNIVQQLTTFVVKNSQDNDIISELIKEISNLDLSRESSSGSKSVAKFLEDLTENCTPEILASIDTLLPYLDEDPYNMRNTVLTIIGKLIINCLKDDQDQKQLREQLLDFLEEHIHDTIGYVRSRALNIWKELCQEGAIPVNRLDTLIETVVGRLRDKGANVRKAAVQFLTEFLEKNPFSGRFDLEKLNEMYLREKTKLDKMIEESEKAAQAEEEQAKQRQQESNGESEEQVVPKEEVQEPMDTVDAAENKKDESDLDQTLIGDVDATLIDNVADDDILPLPKQQIYVKYLGDAVKFNQQIQLAIPLVCSLLHALQVQDVKAAINFFVSAHRFEIEGALTGIRKMLVLIFSQDKQVREAVVSAYKEIYLQSSNYIELSYRQRDVAIVNSLVELVKSASVGEKLSLAELLKTLFENNELGKEHTDILFEIFTRKRPNTSAADSIAALQLLAMLAGYNRDLIRSNIDTFVSMGLTEFSDDLHIVQYTCICLQKAVNDKAKVEDTDPPYRFAPTHVMFEQIKKILISTFADAKKEHWTEMSEEAVRAIYKLAEYPDTICEEVIFELMAIAFSPLCQKPFDDLNSQTLSQASQLVENDDTEPIVSQSNTITNDSSHIHPAILERFLALIGNVALNQLIHMESSITTEIKTRRYIKELKETNDKERAKRMSMGGSRSRKSMGNTTINGENMEEEMGLAGAPAVDDVEAEAILHLCNSELVENPQTNRPEKANLLAMLSPLVVDLAQSKKYTDVNLRSTAALTLAKFMMTSESFCKKHLRLLVTILTKSEAPLIRKNIIVAMGDLAVRNPNFIDAYTDHLYSPLSDPDIQVRSNALKVLTRLILSEMIKIKGKLSEIAKLVVDENESLSSTSRLFFMELKKRENAIYNVLPDIISNLSGGETPMNEEQFKQVMKFLFELLDKDKQAQGLVEKLCHRFTEPNITERQWRDLSLCLSLINYSDRSLQKLNESRQCFANKLGCDVVYENFMSIIISARKMPNIKNETKTMLNELETLIEQCRSKGTEGDADESEMQEIMNSPSAFLKRKAPGSATKSASKQPQSKAVRSKQKKPARRSRRRESDEEVSDMDDDDSNQTPASAPARRTGRERKARNLNYIMEDDESD